MFLFFVDTSNERGQRACLLEAEHPSYLHSYAYRGASIWRGVTQYWENLIVLGIPPRTIIDSGAFTAWSAGKLIRPEDYGYWALSVRSEWADKMVALDFMNLDVIGDQEESWSNQAMLERMGLNPMPIITYGADLKHLDRALAEYPYIALGGLVPHASSRANLSQWLDLCFQRVMTVREKTGKMPRVHLLGVTREWVLMRYPAYSADSSTWTRCLRFGEDKSLSAGIPRAGKIGHEVAMQFAIKNNIQRYQRLQETASNLWKRRGIEFSDR